MNYEDSTTLQNIGIILSLLVSMSALILPFLQLFTRPRLPKTKEIVDRADATEKITSSASQLVEMFRKEVESLRAEVNQLKEQVKQIPILEKENGLLKNDNASLRLRVNEQEQKISAQSLEIESLRKQIAEVRINGGAVKHD